MSRIGLLLLLCYVLLCSMVIRRFPRPYLRLFLVPNTSSTISRDGNGIATDGSGQVQANITNLNPTIDATMKIVQNWRFYVILGFKYCV